MAMARAIRNKLRLIGLATQSNSLGLGLGLELGLDSCCSKRWMETLAFEEVRASNSNDKPYDSTAFVLHGLLGSGRNWRSFARNLASHLTSNSSSEWRFVLVDLRNHGRSAEVQGLQPPHDLDNAARDLANLVESHGWDWPDAVIGHSLGGKIALQYAQSGARGDYGNSMALPKQSSSGCWTRYLELDKDYWDLLEHPPKDTEISLVRAENSDRWDTETVQRLEKLASKERNESEGRFSLHVLPKSGHWVHVDNPKGLLEIIGSGIASLG